MIAKVLFVCVFSVSKDEPFHFFSGALMLNDICDVGSNVFMSESSPGWSVKKSVGLISASKSCEFVVIFWFWIDSSMCESCP